MLSVADLTTRAPTWRKLLEVRTNVFAAGKEFLQLQLISEDYVLTRIGNEAIAFFRQGGRRYTVDRAQKVLRPLDPASLWTTSLTRTRVTVSLQDGPVEVDGYACRRLTIESRLGLVTLSTESYYASFGGIERTPLHQERVLSAPDGYPAHLLGPSELLVYSATRVRQGDFEQMQTSRLSSLRADPDGGDDELEPLTYPRTDAIHV
jgi:hypothetical protein